jgi:hypothetical protein
MAKRRRFAVLMFSSLLSAPVVVAVITVWMMQMAVDQVINMAAVRDRLVAAARDLPAQ